MRANFAYDLGASPGVPQYAGTNYVSDFMYLIESDTSIDYLIAPDCKPYCNTTNPNTYLLDRVYKTQIDYLTVPLVDICYLPVMQGVNMLLSEFAPGQLAYKLQPCLTSCTPYATYDYVAQSTFNIEIDVDT